MCRFIASGRVCDFGPDACTFAHSQEELDSWREQREAAAAAAAAPSGAGPAAAAAVVVMAADAAGEGAAQEKAGAGRAEEHALFTATRQPGSLEAAAADAAALQAVLDTLPSRDAFEALQGGDSLLRLREHEGMPLTVQKDSLQELTWRLTLEPARRDASATPLRVLRVVLADPSSTSFAITAARLGTGPTALLTAPARMLDKPLSLTVGLEARL